MSFSKRPGKNTPQCYTKPLDSLKNWNNRFFWVDECVFPTAVEWRTNASKDRMSASGTYSVEAVRVMDTHRTPIQKQPEALLCLPLDSLKNWNNRFFWVDECVFPTTVEWRTNASKDRMPESGTYSVEAVRVLDTHRTPIQKQPEALLCLVGISRRYYLGDDVYPTFHYDDDRGGLIRAPNPTKVKTESRPRAPHELSLLTLTAPRVIEMDEPAAATDSSGVPSAIERSLLDFVDEAEASGRETAAPEMPPPEEVPNTTAPGGTQAAKTVAVEPPAVRESRKRGHEGIDANAPPKSLRRDHADLRPSVVGNKMHKAFPLPGESSHWQYKFPLPVEGVPTARRIEIPLLGVCTAMMKKLPVKENWQLH
uniref:Transposase (Putative), gypsy type n=1 Tax=Tanacetum cinerariifolium TaxID=118510 RepID=A0A699JIR1_TANCI|nr:hypothetical protein [Tanacetum cinerariifolium]